MNLSRKKIESSLFYFQHVLLENVIKSIDPLTHLQHCSISRRKRSSGAALARATAGLARKALIDMLRVICTVREGAFPADAHRFRNEHLNRLRRICIIAD